MTPFTVLTATAVPLRAENVDTDQIIPARYLTAVTRAGMGEGLFAAWRYDAEGRPRPDFVLNRPEYAGAQILIAGRNFGSGSSREHAVWALTEYGFRAVISPGFADIFYNNALKNGLLPVVLPERVVHALWDRVEAQPQSLITIDLAAQTVRLPDGEEVTFVIDPYRKLCLLQGVDDLGYLLAQEEAITAYERARGLAPVV
jgi:3-isopropylmalate/(R)-2-methylmalate dehydratase small subunit